MSPKRLTATIAPSTYAASPIWAFRIAGSTLVHVMPPSVVFTVLPLPLTA